MSVKPSWKEAFKALLGANTNITGIVGSDIYMGNAPKGTTGSYIVWLGAGNNRVQHKGDRKLEFRRVQVDGFADGGADADALGRAIDSIDGSSQGIIKDVRYIDDNDKFDEDSGDYGVSMDFQLTIKYP